MKSLPLKNSIPVGMSSGSSGDPQKSRCEMQTSGSSSLPSYEMQPVRTETAAKERIILEMRNVSKTYGHARALHSVSLNIREGEIHSLTGENGAGKSTLMKILAGAVTPDTGSEIWAFGRRVSINRPQDAAALGISIIYQ